MIKIIEGKTSSVIAALSALYFVARILIWLAHGAPIVP